ncbi:5-amino-6-(5-phosphoribosylamino)uracil reductase [Haloactinospora alba]|uniref:5-amino-6-(5-phosphoribosylamino)uracil reductase n=1 Tax=Haloactinospora alba TaxID=405555 RepID=A0A543NH58_9ACTN|nr:RibD family protein [Haloactinospora alba]TQN31139.1 5-amino-6-(5-phosphoribosylamino)uracil reductase [Haloactinospora alba]
MDRPHTIVSCAMSADGYIDDTGSAPLRLSNDADAEEVDQLRADCDAILVGAQTVRRDDPRLLVRSEERRRRRIEQDKPENPVKVALSQSGKLDPQARFFTAGNAGKLLYTASGRSAAARRFAGAERTIVVDGGDPIDPRGVLADLARRGVGRLLVEGGSHIHTLFLTAGLADELRLAVAPFFVGDPAAPRFVGSGTFPHTPTAPMRLVETRVLGDVAVLRYITGGEE